MARTSGNIRKRYYKIMHRAPAAFTVPADAAAFATFLGTMTDLGICEDKTISVSFEENETVDLDDGTQKKVDFIGKVEGTLLQSETADYTAYEAIENVEQDLLIYDESNEQCIFIPNALIFFAESVNSGDVERVPFSYQKTVAAKSDFRTRFDEATT